MNNSGLQKRWRFLVGGVRFGNHNVGDEAILEGVVSVLRRLCPNCSIFVLTDQPALTASRLGVKAFPYQFVGHGDGLPHRLLRVGCRFIENFLHTYLATRADVIVCGGATMLSDCPEVVLRLAGLGMFAKKRLIYFPGGMNPGNSDKVLQQIRDIVNEFDLFMLRDAESKKLLVEAGCRETDLFVTLDSAFNAGLNVQHLTEKTCITLKGNTVGIGISHEPDCASHNNPEDWACIADFIVNRFQANVVFLPSNTQAGKDIAAMEDIHRRMHHADAANVCRTELSPQEMVEIISGFDMMISSRLHQLIFSLFADTPFVAISRCAKTENFCAMLGINPAVATRECTLERIRLALEKTWNTRDLIRERNRVSRTVLMQRACKTEQLVRDCLCRPEDSRKAPRPLSHRFRYLIRAYAQRMVS